MAERTQEGGETTGKNDDIQNANDIMPSACLAGWLTAAYMRIMTRPQSPGPWPLGYGRLQTWLVAQVKLRLQKIPGSIDCTPPSKPPLATGAFKKPVVEGLILPLPLADRSQVKAIEAVTF